jgi:predicted Zn-dependent protease
LAERALSFVSADAAVVTVGSARTGFTEFALGEVTGASDTQYATVGVLVAHGPRSAEVTTTRLDDASLRLAVEKAQALVAAARVDEDDVADDPGEAGAINAALWHEGTLDVLLPARRAEAVRSAMAASARGGSLSGGVVGGAARSTAVLTSGGHFEYGRTSTAECTVTARTRVAGVGQGSGWAAWKGEDWALLDVEQLAQRAASLAQRTEKAVAVEPGRYTVVLSPMALSELVGAIAAYGTLDGRSADEGRSPFSRPRGGTTIGEKIFDSKVTLSADPMDPDGGFLPFAVNGRHVTQYRAETWARDGVLERLAYESAYARARQKEPAENSGALRMNGGGVANDDLLAKVERGIYVTRFSHIGLVSFRTLLMSGVTRDGTFLIERGSLTTAVRDLRFEDSPMRLLQNVAALGTAVRVPVGGPPMVMPGAVVTDFLFTGMSHAV